MTLVISKSFTELYQTLGGFMGDGLCSKHIQDKIKKLDNSKYEKILAFMTNQKMIELFHPVCSMYKTNIFTKKVDHHIDIQSKIDNMFHTTLQADNNFIFLNCLSIDTLFVFLTEHADLTNRYIFIPVVFGSEVDKVGHFSNLIFDCLENKVYFVDPNGRTKFFDDVLIKHSNSDINFFQDFVDDMYIDSETLIEKIFVYYINELNKKFETNYTFVERKKWNPYCYNINRSIADSQIGVGHCVITSIFISHYLYITNIDIAQLFGKFNAMNNGEILELINSYSMGIYNFLLLQ